MGINVLSLFDGMSCGQLALKKAGIKVDTYFASEIDKYAIKVTQHNFPDTIQLGDVTKVFAKDLPKIDVVIGGSPCQGFSFAGKQLNFEDPRSKLFFEYVRLVKECNPKYFLLENVKMKKEHEIVITQHLNVRPIEINSSLLSAQNRERLYWTNINEEPDGFFGHMKTNIKQPKDKGLLLRDILETDVHEKYFLSDKMINYLNTRKANFNSGKINYKTGEDVASCINASSGHLDISDNIIIDRNDALLILNERQKANHKEDNEKANTFLISSWKGSQANGMTLVGHANIRRLTPVECERLQTVPDNYTDIVSDTQRYRMIGNG